MNVVCKHCKESRKEESMDRFDINFFEKKIFWMCPCCKKMNSLDLNNPGGEPYPKIRMRS